MISAFLIFYSEYFTFIRRFYPKRLTVHSGYIFFYQYVCSLGIEPTTFCAANAMLYHWATGTLMRCTGTQEIMKHHFGMIFHYVLMKLLILKISFVFRKSFLKIKVIWCNAYAETYIKIKIKLVHSHECVLRSISLLKHQTFCDQANLVLIVKCNIII